MRDCPKCGKHELDVTGQGPPMNDLYRCWNCGFSCYRNQIKKFEKEGDKNVRKDE